MTTCKKIKFYHRGICAGDLDRKITIQSRAIGAPVTTVDFDHSFVAEKTVWAALKTLDSIVGGRQMFDETNMDDRITHVFYVRWYSGLTAESWVLYKNERYDIVYTENLDERDEFLALMCNVRGDESRLVNNA